MKCGDGEKRVEQGNENDSLKNEEGPEVEGRKGRLLKEAGVWKWGA